MRILALDLGTSSIKLLRMDGHGAVLSVDRVPMTSMGVEGWIDALRTNIEVHGDGREIRALALTGQMHGLMTRESGDTWGEGIPWHDTRSAAMIPGLQEVTGPGATVATGGPMAPGFLGASLAWIRENDPNRWASIRSVHLPKDALIHALTGAHITDPSDAVGTGLFSPQTGDWEWSIVDALGIPHSWLPRRVPSGSIAGFLCPAYAHLLGLPTQTPFMAAGGDAPVGAFGAGVTRESDALIMLSTGAQVILPAREWSPDREGRWYTWPSVAPASGDNAPYLKVGTLLNAGNLTSWAEETLPDGRSVEGPSGLVALPHLIGTREDPRRSAAIVGLTASTTAGDIRRAVMEGLAYAVRATLENMAADNLKPARVHLGGGLSHRKDIRQLFADVLGIPVQPVTQPELSAYGAALLALYTLAGQLPQSATDTGRLTQPQEDDRYEESYALYRELDRALAPLDQRLASLRNGRP